MSQTLSPAPAERRMAPAAIESYVPATFLARGVAVPFTTPQLAGARVRSGARGKTELILPNPSGKAGVYIVSWQELGGTCRPSVHDGRLAGLIGDLTRITPAAIRGCVRDVAADGFAGREAMAAAHAAVSRDESIQAIRQRELMQALLARHAPAAGDLEAIHAAIGRLAQCFVGVGTAGSEDAPLAVELAAMARLHGEVTAHATAHADIEAAPLLNVAGLTLTCARLALHEAQQLTTDMLDLLRRWQGARDALIQFLARPDWLLDGWGHICALWRRAEPHRRGIAIMEMTGVMPILPTEVETWMVERVDISNQLIRSPGKVVIRQDWRSGIAVQDMVARNESLLAATL